MPEMTHAPAGLRCEGRPPRLVSASQALLCLVASAVATVAHPSPARADAADECIAAAEQSQPLRRDGRLRAARQKLIVCSRPECPSLVRSDCAKWLSDVEALTPSIVVRAVDAAGADVVGVRVLVDGEAQEAREGKELEVDPGTHTLRVEHEGSAAVEQRIVVRESERHRMVSVSFATSGAGAPGPAPAAAAPPSSTPPETPPASSRSLLMPIALIAVGGVGLGVASYFWASGLSDHSTMASSTGCSQTHTCSQSEIDSARGKLIAGDVVGGASLVAAAVGVGLIVFGGSSAPQATPVAVEPLPGGGLLQMRGRF
jgi:hypothetical protein